MRLRISLGIRPRWRTTYLAPWFGSPVKSNCLMHRGQAHANCQSAAWHGVHSVHERVCRISNAAVTGQLGHTSIQRNGTQSLRFVCYWSAVKRPHGVLNCAAASCSNRHQHPIVHKVLTCVSVCLLSRTPGCFAYRVYDLRASRRCFDAMWLWI